MGGGIGRGLASHRPATPSFFLPLSRNNPAQATDTDEGVRGSRIASWTCVGGRQGRVSVRCFCGVGAHCCPTCWIMTHVDSLSGVCVRVYKGGHREKGRDRRVNRGFLSLRRGDRDHSVDAPGAYKAGEMCLPVPKRPGKHDPTIAAQIGRHDAHVRST